jgi:hypothetical protein
LLHRDGDVTCPECASTLSPKVGAAESGLQLDSQAG